MKNVKLFTPALILCLCLIFVSTAFSAKPPSPYVSYHGYAILDDNGIIKSDDQGQYIDRDFTSKNPKNKQGDRIEVTLEYNSKTGQYDLKYFLCFLGKPEPPWNSERRVHFNFDIAGGENVASELNQKVADMLLYNVIGFPNSRRGEQVGTTQEYRLTDDSVHITIQKGTVGNENNEVSAIFLVDKSNTADDPNAITQANLEAIDPNAPRYWTSLEGVSSTQGGETDAQDHIGFFLFKYQLEFNPIGYDIKDPRIPITWEVKPIQGPVNIYVRRVTDPEDPAYSYVEEPLWTFNNFPFRLIVSKYSLEGRTLAPPKQVNTITDTWGNMKSK